MKMNAKTTTDQELAQRRQRRLEAMHLQDIEGNPLDADDIAMFEMFERERWTDEQCLDHLNEKARELAAKHKLG